MRTAACGPFVLGVAAAAAGQTCPPSCGSPAAVSPGVRVVGTVGPKVVHDEDGAGPLPARLFLGGGVTEIGGVPVNRLARWDGAAFSDAGAGLGAENVRALASFGGALFVAGHFLQPSGFTRAQAKRWNGQAWELLADPPEDPWKKRGPIHAMVTMDDGTGPALYAAVQYHDTVFCGDVRVFRWQGPAPGVWVQVGGPIVGISTEAMVEFDADGAGPQPARLHHAGQEFSTHSCAGYYGRLSRFNGSEWEILAHGDGLAIMALTVAKPAGQPQPRLYVGGLFTALGGVAASNLASYDGVSFAAVAGAPNGMVTEVATVDPDGAGTAQDVVVAVGDFTVAGGIGAPRLAMWTGSQWQAPTGGITHTGIAQSISMEPFDADGAGPQEPGVVVTGPLTLVGGMAANGFGYLQPVLGAWRGAALGPAGQVRAVAMYNDGGGRDLYAGGVFPRAGNMQARNIARWDGAGWTPLGAGVNGEVRALAVHDDGSGLSLFAGGVFTAAGGAAVQNVARWGVHTWYPVGAGLQGQVNALEVHDPDGAGGVPAALFAGGQFSVGGTAANVAQWNGAAWSALGSGVNGPVYALRSFNDGSGPALFVGGNFTQAGGQASRSVAKWNGAAWLAAPQVMNGDVRAFGIYDTGQGARLYAAGSFVFGPHGSERAVGRWEGGLFHGLTGGYSPTQGQTLRVYDDGSGAALYMGTGNGRLWKFDGSAWEEVGGLFYGEITSLSVPFDLGCGTSLFVGGTFARIDQEPASRVAVVGPRSGCVCYANCDSSTAAPVLNVSDLTCFMQRFAAGDSRANCDQGTVAPILNVADFTCFLKRFAAGCP